MRDIVVQFFNSDGVLDHLQKDLFTPEYEEEWFTFSVDERGTLFIYNNTDYTSRLVKVYSTGRWAEAEYK